MKSLWLMESNIHTNLNYYVIVGMVGGSHGVLIVHCIPTCILHYFIINIDCTMKRTKFRAW